MTPGSRVTGDSAVFYVFVGHDSFAYVT